ncbi:hypothetical protein GCM10020331_041610 [Ectobacillus funiculus]
MRPKYKAKIIKGLFASSWCLSFIYCVFLFVVFETIGYHALAIGLLILLFIPTAVMLRMEEGIVTSSVIVMHIYSLKKQ